ncbi:hypothetical protein DOTSEDRAFT_21825 [Dothistroma septosporum NZE10]|uniref:Uncharacterized protein n=1 Tax=Dothistroma septosporum (strain NZE10 / CBS 128990) TaxID=675120 RepID=N1PXI6_DOTSN|nr:hypothetical protein DOTSEDRAFT_21825 [Dothistroma septosporum NZE10]
MPVERKRSDLPEADPTAFSTSNFQQASCYDSGHTWTSDWMVRGADMFCESASNIPVGGGGYLNYTHHVCADGQDYMQWFSFENPDTKDYNLEYPACRLYTQPFIDDCDLAKDDSSVKQGGWGIRSAGMNGNVIVDGECCQESESSP